MEVVEGAKMPRGSRELASWMIILAILTIDQNNHRLEAWIVEERPLLETGEEKPVI